MRTNTAACWFWVVRVVAVVVGCCWLLLPIPLECTDIPSHCAYKMAKQHSTDSPQWPTVIFLIGNGVNVVNVLVTCYTEYLSIDLFYYRKKLFDKGNNIT